MSKVGETVATVVGTRSTTVEEVKTMIAEKFRMSATEPPRLYQLACGTQVLDNKSTLGRSRIRGKVTLTIIVRNGSESESEFSGMPALVGSSDSE